MVGAGRSQNIKNVIVPVIVIKNVITINLLKIIFYTISLNFMIYIIIIINNISIYNFFLNFNNSNFLPLNNNLIALVGFMGVGKSSLGKGLSKKLKFFHIDTDIEIEKKKYEN